MRTAPFTQLACRAANTDPDWWGIDATPAQQTLAATLCMGCPAITACDQYRQHLSTDAAGTYAAVYAPLVDVETDTEFLEIAAALGWNDVTADRLNMRDTGSGRWEQLALWGPSDRSGDPTRRRGVRPGGGRPRHRRATVSADTAGA